MVCGQRSRFHVLIALLMLRQAKALNAHASHRALSNSGASDVFYAQAKAAVEAAATHAKTVGDGAEVPMEIAVVDEFANLVRFEQMGKGCPGCTDVALKKARSAIWFKMESNHIGQNSQPGGAFYGAEESNGGLSSFGGGLFLVGAGGKPVGGIGVSGGSDVMDKAVAQAGKEAFEAVTVYPAPSVTYEDSMAVLEAALNETSSFESQMNAGKSVSMSVAVVDAGGNVMQFARQDGAWLGSADIAIKKAKTAALFCRPVGTSAMAGIVKSGAPFWGVDQSNGGLSVNPGGLALKKDGMCVGGVGVSGDHPDIDAEVAKAGVAALEAGTVWTVPACYAFVDAGTTFDIPLADALDALQASRTHVLESHADALVALQASRTHVIDSGGSIPPMNIAMTDAGGNLIAFTRMADAMVGAADIAVKKAVTSISAWPGATSGAVGGISDPSKVGNFAYGIELSNGGLMTFPGGVSVTNQEGHNVGGIGVSGGSPDQDHGIAEYTHDWMSQKAFISDPEPLTLDRAQAMISASKRKGVELGKAFCYCIVDRFLNVVDQQRNDGAFRVSIDLACKKAKTAMMFGYNTGDLGALSQPALDGDITKAPFYRIERSNNYMFPGNILAANAGHWGAHEPGGVMTFAGGIPIPSQSGTTNIGGIGVSGGHVTEDHAVAAAGIDRGAFRFFVVKPDAN